MRKTIARLIILLFALGCSKEKQQVPGTFALSAPAQNLVCTTGKLISATQTKIALSWTVSVNAASYDVTTTNLLTQAITVDNVTGTSDSVTLLQNTPYSWFITAKTANGQGTTKSDTWKFYSAGNGVVTYAPYPATILSPTLGQIVTANTGGISAVNLTWAGSSTSGNITAYNVYFGSVTNAPLLKSNITDSFLKNVGVTAGTTYYWHVATIDSNGNISDSGLFSFLVK